jgi:hypothetical protein
MITRKLAPALGNTRSISLYISIYLDIYCIIHLLLINILYYIIYIRCGLYSCDKTTE